MNDYTQSVIAILLLIVVISLFSFLAQDQETAHSDTQHTITAQHTFTDGMHTYRGVIDFLSTCDELKTEATVRESSPEQVTLAFTAIPTRQPCPDVVDPKPFTITFEGSKTAQVEATFNEEPAQLIVEEVENNATSSSRAEIGTTTNATTTYE